VPGLYTPVDLPLRAVIGLVSDTHGWYHTGLDADLAGCDLILHSGDIGTPDVLDRLERIAPTYAVWGNIDGADIRRRVPEHQRLDLNGLRVWMTHIGGRPGRWEKGIGPALTDGPPDAFVCGHSHILRVERVARLGRMLYLNPGAAGRQGFHRIKTCLRLTLEDGRATGCEVVELDG
jgi:putative phosphoesterase